MLKNLLIMSNFQQKNLKESKNFNSTNTDNIISTILIQLSCKLLELIGENIFVRFFLLLCSILFSRFDCNILKSIRMYHINIEYNFISHP